MHCSERTHECITIPIQLTINVVNTDLIIQCDTRGETAGE